ncbi:hypothetical protein AVEN_176606-1 [Araneus ventricosus]|uniref:Uncharacterized protein n=1 Tax=Araneus ventricosus TaxID=182803 RepID=A0A4Y2EIP7_ARAVE|nr:hypothetical protein AVEN_176606-1 [Araneus ventricosus]
MVPLPRDAFHLLSQERYRNQPWTSLISALISLRGADVSPRTDTLSDVSFSVQITTLQKDREGGQGVWTDKKDALLGSVGRDRLMEVDRWSGWRIYSWGPRCGREKKIIN